MPRRMSDAQMRTVIQAIDNILLHVDWEKAAVGSNFPKGLKQMEEAIRQYKGLQKTVEDTYQKIGKIARESIDRTSLTRHPMTTVFYYLVAEIDQEQLSVFTQQNIELFTRLANQFIHQFSLIKDRQSLMLDLLKQAVDADSAEIFSLLLNGVDEKNLEQTQKTLLLYAAEKNATKVLSFLLEQHISPDTRYANTSQTALHVAVKAGAAECAAILLAAGARTDMQDAKLQTPLHLAVINQKLNLIEPLAGPANVNMKDRDGNTAAHYAAKAGMETALTELQRKGADFHIQDNFGKNVNQVLTEQLRATYGPVRATVAHVTTTCYSPCVIG